MNAIFIATILYSCNVNVFSERMNSLIEGERDRKKWYAIKCFDLMFNVTFTNVWTTIHLLLCNNFPGSQNLQSDFIPNIMNSCEVKQMLKSLPQHFLFKWTYYLVKGFSTDSLLWWYPHRCVCMFMLVLSLSCTTRKSQVKTSFNVMFCWSRLVSLLFDKLLCVYESCILVVNRIVSGWCWSMACIQHSIFVKVVMRHLFSVDFLTSIVSFWYTHTHKPIRKLVVFILE